MKNFVSQKFDVIVAHVTDTYFVEETSVNNQVDIPGFSRIFSFLESLRNNSDRSQQIPVIALHGGDFLFPSLMSNYFQGKQMVDVLNMCDFDYCTLGNHDFEGGIEILKRRLSEANFSVLCANLQYRQSGENHDDDHTFKISSYALWPNYSDKEDNNNDHPKIAILGIAGKSTARKAKQIGFDTFSVKSSLKKILNNLHHKYPSIDHLVVISHMNNAEDLELKQWLDNNWNGYAYVLGGHDHNETLHYDKSNPNSILLKGQSNGRTIQIIGINFKQNYNQKNNVTKTLSKSHNLLDNVYVMNSDELSSFTPDSQVQNMVIKWEQLLEREIGDLNSDITVKQFDEGVVLDATELELRKGSTNFGNFVTDCILRYTDSDIVLINSGHFRGDRKVGNILKLSDLKRIFVMSTKNRIIKTEMTCAECKAFLRHAYSEEGRGKILQISKDTVRLLCNSNDDEKFSVTMLYDMINEDDDGFSTILANLRNTSPNLLRQSLRDDIIWNYNILDMILDSSKPIPYDPSVRLSVKNFSKKKL